MKKMKRLVAVLLAGVMALTMLTACGGGGGGGSTTTEKEIAEAFAKASGIILIDDSKYVAPTEKYINRISEDLSGYYTAFQEYSEELEQFLQDYKKYLESLDQGNPIAPPQLTLPEDNQYCSLLREIWKEFSHNYTAIGIVTLLDGDLSAAEIINNFNAVTPPSSEEGAGTLSAYIRVAHVSNSSGSAWVIFMVMPVSISESGE